MEKPAVTDYPIHDLLSRRWSPLAFDQHPIPEDTLHRLFEAARWAASSYNEQPWSYILGVKAQDPAQFERLASTLVPQNAWAKQAPVLVLSVAKTTFTSNGSPNRVAFHDVGMATANLVLEATSEGIFVHQMGGYDAAKARELFAIPEGYEPVAMIALGFPGDAEALPEAWKARDLAPRKRKPVSEFVFRGNWGAGSV